MLRRWISVFLASLVLANLAIWPSAALAEALEHQHEAALLDAQNLPADPSPAHCKHGCAGHYGQHFQAQGPTSASEPRIDLSDSIASIAEAFPPLHVPALPFRPPLSASIRS